MSWFVIASSAIGLITAGIVGAMKAGWIKIGSATATDLQDASNAASVVGPILTTTVPVSGSLVSAGQAALSQIAGAAQTAAATAHSAALSAAVTAASNTAASVAAPSTVSTAS